MFGNGTLKKKLPLKDISYLVFIVKTLMQSKLEHSLYNNSCNINNLLKYCDCYDQLSVVKKYF